MLQLFSRAESARAVIERRPNCPADSNLDGSDRSAVLKNLQLRGRFGWSLSNLAALLRQQLFVIATSGPGPISASSGRRCWMPLPSRFPFLGQPTWTAVIRSVHIG